MALDSQALTTVLALRQWLTQDSTADTDGRLSQAALESLINRASAAIERYCDRALIAPSEPVTWRLDGTGSRRLLLPEWPVVEFVSLQVDGQSVPPWTAGESGYFVRAETGQLELLGLVAPRGHGNVEVVARCGYDATKAATDRQHRQALRDLEQACLLLAAHWFWSPVPGRTRVETDGAAVALAPEPWPPLFCGLLAPWRRMGG